VEEDMAVHPVSHATPTPVQQSKPQAHVESAPKVAPVKIEHPASTGHKVNIKT